jgi:molybdenum cofactor sulfurtransferase
MNIYFDNASSMLYSNELLKHILSDTNKYSNPHSFSNESQMTTNKINEIRNKVLSYLNISDDVYECIFTSGTTDSLKRIGEYFCWNNSTNFIYTVDNHTSVVGIREYALSRGSDVTVIDFDNDNNLVELNTWFRPENKGKFNDNTKVNLFAMPYESNFSGKKYPMNYINLIKNKYGQNTIFLLDIAKYISSNKVNLSNNIVDIACISFYKLFGYPTGLGALIIKKSVIKYINKKQYFGGGAISVSSSSNDYSIARSQFYEWLEDGSPNYLGIISLDKCLEKTIDSNHISEVTYYFYNKIKDMTYSNGQKIFELYDVPKDAKSLEEFSQNHGSIITFNIFKSDGLYLGYKEFEKVCALHGIAIRTGCLCNIGACSKNLNITFSELQTNFLMGHTCGDDIDIINGKPIGAIRVSFGTSNTIEEVDLFMTFINTNFIEYYSKNINKYFGNSSFINKNELVINNLIIFPIKSCSGFEVDTWEIGNYGFLYDREWSLINSENKVLQQKKCRNLAFMKCYIDLSKKVLNIQYEDKYLTIDIAYTPEESVTQKQCVYTNEGYVYSDNINKWFCECLGISCRLVRSSGSRKIGSTEKKLSFSNEGQFLLVNTNSINALNKKGDFNYNYTRYRPNIVITTNETNEPYEEDNWKSIENSNSKMIIIDRCKRCNMINIPQKDDDIEDPKNTRDFEPLLTLSKFRRERSNIYFGVLLYTEYGEQLSVGDKFLINHR